MFPNMCKTLLASSLFSSNETTNTRGNRHTRQIRVIAKFASNNTDGFVYLWLKNSVNSKFFHFA